MRSKPFYIFGIVLSFAIAFSSVLSESIAGVKNLASHVEQVSTVASHVGHVPTVASTSSVEQASENDHAAPTNSYYYYRAQKRIPAKVKRTIPVASAAPAVAPKPRVTLLASIDQPDIQEKHKLIANEVLMALPAQCRNTLQNFYVKYTKQDRRGLAGKSVIILDGTVPDEEFRALFTHESGHNFDIGCLEGTAPAGKSAFSNENEAIYKDDPSMGFYRISWITSAVQRSDSRSEDFVSGYAKADIFEDFAETFAYFVLQNNAFLQRAQTNEALARKYVWMRDTLFNGQIPEVATGKSEVAKNPPWDVTKLPYEWHPKATLVQR